MADGHDWVAALRGLERHDWGPFLREHSGLPGPRANLPLVDAVVAIADGIVVDGLVADHGEFAMMCAAAYFGSRADETECEDQARRSAGDARWRVREGVAIGLQHLAARSFAEFREVAGRWVHDSDLLVQRAAVAAVCEPRLLRSSDSAAAAIDLCHNASLHLAALPRERRREPAARTLRQTLGYAWSVAVAAAPTAGLRAFADLDTADPDIAWIVAQNRRKRRLAVLLGD